MVRIQSHSHRLQWVYVGLLAFAALAFLQIGLLGINKLRAGSPIVGLRFEGTRIGGLPDKQAQDKMTTIMRQYQGTPMTIRAQHFTSHATLSQVGLYISEPAVRQEVNQIGHTGTIWHKIWLQNRALVGLLNVRLRPAVNTAVATAYIERMQQAINISSVDASYQLVGRTVIVRADTDGLTIPIAPALQRLAAADPRRDTPVILPLSHPEAPLTASMLTPPLRKMQHMASQPLKITAAGYSVELSRADIVIATIPKVVSDPAHPSQKTVQLTFDEAKLKAVAATVWQQATIKPQPVLIRDGDVVRQGTDGRKPKDVDAAKLIAAALVQRQTNPTANPAVDLPMVADKAPVVYESRPLVRQNTGNVGGGVHLTFDDGPGAYTQQILDILARYHVHATFYVIGKNVVAHPGDMKRTVAEGHEIGNHSWSHANLTSLSWNGVYQELARTQTAVQQTAGVTPTKFRPPYGAVNNTVRNAAATLGLSVNLWSIDTSDWAQPGTNTIIRRALTGDHNGSVILLHVLHTQTVNALPSIIEGIRAQGYTIN